MHGTKEEIGKALNVLSRLNNPKYNEQLRALMDSEDPVLAVMAAYALGEAGEKAGFEFIDAIYSNNPAMFVPAEQMPDHETLHEILKLCSELNPTFELYNRSNFVEAKEKIGKLLGIYATQPITTGVKYFDDLIRFTFKKTKGMLLDALAICEFHIGTIENALYYSREAIGIAEETGDQQLLKTSYADLGHIYLFFGNYYSALELLHKSLEIDAASNDPWRKRNRALSNLSHLYYLLGRHDKALKFGREALEYSKKENDPNGAARCFNTLGVISTSLNELRDAKMYLQEALQLTVDELNNQALQSLILNNLAYIEFLGSEIGKAKEYLSSALELAILAFDKSTEGTILSTLAMIEMEEGSTDNARRTAGAALEIFKNIYNPSGQADALFLLGSIEDILSNNPLGAYNYYYEAINISENLRENLFLDDFKISFAGKHVALYQQMIQLCIRTGKIEEVYQYIERSRSMAFVDMLASTSNTIGAKVLSPEEIEEVTNLRGKLDLLRRQIAASYSGVVDIEKCEMRRENIAEEIVDLEERYVKNFDDIKLKDPKWSSLVSINISDMADVQCKLDEHTVLLEFYQTEKSLIVLVIRKNAKISAVEIPIDIEIESERLLSLIASISAGGAINIRDHEFIKQVKKPLSHFHDLLISPLQEMIKDAQHLIVIPHNVWHYLPFHALYDKNSRQYLIDRFNISQAPSATALDLCTRDTNARRYSSAVILANPSGDLSHAEEEGKVIFGKFDNAALFVKDQATLSKVLEHRDADVIHLACHGYFRGDEPLFSHLMLADAAGGVGPFFLPDIFNLNLDTFLVTLSACETGLSQVTAGDDLIGISRAFFYAGCTSLIASLWTVNDKSTALFMDRFYDQLINRDKGKAEALRNAILDLKAMSEYSHPYFWAPFYLSGDWR